MIHAVGIVGLGMMGTYYAEAFGKDEIAGGRVAAVCDASEQRRKWAAEHLSDCRVFETPEALFQSGAVDAVIIATPHKTHPLLTIAALDAGLHVMCEKPAGVDALSVETMNDRASEADRSFAMMFNQRMHPLYQKVRDLIRSGALGIIKRTSWTITDWYRSQAYYESSSWRATWAGEGGGVLLNQAPHQLDLWLWMTGLEPVEVRGICENGKYREIEVEDEVTAYIKFKNGASGVFITSVSEAPGTNRLEIAGTKGRIVIENDEMVFNQTENEPEFNLNNKAPFARPEVKTIYSDREDALQTHHLLLENWLAHLAHGEALVSPGEEGIKSLRLANAIYLSSWTDQPVHYPVNDQLFSRMLAEKAADSRYSTFI